MSWFTNRPGNRTGYRAQVAKPWRVAWVFWMLSHGVAAWAASQPIAYSHKQHLSLGLHCLDCHSSADTSSAATLPSLHKCMLCHAKVATAKPEIQKLASFAAAKREVPWQRVYGFDPEALVKFRHAPHFRAKIDCARCHGDMTQVTVAQPVVKHTMGTCLTCHRQNNASEDCAACHY
jgi:Cytochrome c7 and related cytochrome c